MCSVSSSTADVLYPSTRIRGYAKEDSLPYLFIYLISVYTCVCVSTLCTGVHRGQKGVRSLLARVTGGCELPDLGECWELSVDPLGEVSRALNLWDISPDPNFFF